MSLVDAHTSVGAMGLGNDLEARIEAAHQLYQRQLAEYHGLSMARTIHPHVRPSYSHDPRIQEAFVRGLEEGLTLKAVENLGASERRQA
ncbi:MAG: hypothetical protein U0172_03610 [Nitrospiraceae bacterium]